MDAAAPHDDAPHDDALHDDALHGDTTLDCLAAGERGVVTGFAASGTAGGTPPGRLLEMGLVPGTPVEVVRLAPLGDPMDLRVRGFHLSVRKHEAAGLTVRRG